MLIGTNFDLKKINELKDEFDEIAKGYNKEGVAQSTKSLEYKDNMDGNDFLKDLMIDDENVYPGPSTIQRFPPSTTTPKQIFNEMLNRLVTEPQFLQAKLPERSSFATISNHLQTRVQPGPHVNIDDKNRLKKAEDARLKAQEILHNCEKKGLIRMTPEEKRLLGDNSNFNLKGGNPPRYDPPINLGQLHAIYDKYMLEIRAKINHRILIHSFLKKFDEMIKRQDIESSGRAIPQDFFDQLKEYRKQWVMAAYNYHINPGPGTEATLKDVKDSLFALSQSHFGDKPSTPKLSAATKAAAPKAAATKAAATKAAATKAAATINTKTSDDKGKVTTFTVFKTYHGITATVTLQQKLILEQFDKHINPNYKGDKLDNEIPNTLDVGQGKTYMNTLIKKLYKEPHKPNDKIYIDGQLAAEVGPRGVTQADINIHNLDITSFGFPIQPEKVKAKIETIVKEINEKKKVMIICDEYAHLDYYVRKELRKQLPHLENGYILSTVSATPNITYAEIKASLSMDRRSDESVINREIVETNKGRRHSVATAIESDAFKYIPMEGQNSSDAVKTESVEEKSVEEKIVNELNEINHKILGKNVQIILPDTLTSEIIQKAREFHTYIQQHPGSLNFRYIIYKDPEGNVKHINLHSGFEPIPGEPPGEVGNNRALMLYSANDAIGGDFGQYSRHRVGHQFIVTKEETSLTKMQQYFARSRDENPYALKDHAVTMYGKSKNKDEFLERCKIQTARHELLDTINKIRDEIINIVENDLTYPIPHEKRKELIQQIRNGEQFTDTELLQLNSNISLKEWGKAYRTTLHRLENVRLGILDTEMKVKTPGNKLALLNGKFLENVEKAKQFPNNSDIKEILEKNIEKVSKLLEEDINLNLDNITEQTLNTYVNNLLYLSDYESSNANFQLGIEQSKLDKINQHVNKMVQKLTTTSIDITQYKFENAIEKNAINDLNNDLDILINQCIELNKTNLSVNNKFDIIRKLTSLISEKYCFSPENFLNAQLWNKNGAFMADSTSITSIKDKCATKIKERIGNAKKESQKEAQERLEQDINAADSKLKEGKEGVKIKLVQLEKIADNKYEDLTKILQYSENNLEVKDALSQVGEQKKLIQSNLQNIETNNDLHQLRKVVSLIEKNLEKDFVKDLVPDLTHKLLAEVHVHIGDIESTSDITDEDKRNFSQTAQKIIDEITEIRNDPQPKEIPSKLSEIRSSISELGQKIKSKKEQGAAEKATLASNRANIREIFRGAEEKIKTLQEKINELKVKILSLPKTKDDLSESILTCEQDIIPLRSYISTNTQSILDNAISEQDYSKMRLFLEKAKNMENHFNQEYDKLSTSLENFTTQYETEHKRQIEIKERRDATNRMKESDINAKKAHLEKSSNEFASYSSNLKSLITNIDSKAQTLALAYKMDIPSNAQQIIDRNKEQIQSLDKEINEWMEKSKQHTTSEDNIFLQNFNSHNRIARNLTDRYNSLTSKNPLEEINGTLQEHFKEQKQKQDAANKASEEQLKQHKLDQAEAANKRIMDLKKDINSLRTNPDNMNTLQKHFGLNSKLDELNIELDEIKETIEKAKNRDSDMRKFTQEEIAFSASITRVEGEYTEIKNQVARYKEEQSINNDEHKREMENEAFRKLRSDIEEAKQTFTAAISDLITDLNGKCIDVQTESPLTGLKEFLTDVVREAKEKETELEDFFNYIDDLKTWIDSESDSPEKLQSFREKFNEVKVQIQAACDSHYGEVQKILETRKEKVQIFNIKSEFDSNVKEINSLIEDIRDLLKENNYNGINNISDISGHMDSHEKALTSMQGQDFTQMTHEQANSLLLKSQTLLSTVKISSHGAKSAIKEHRDQASEMRHNAQNKELFNTAQLNHEISGYIRETSSRISHLEENIKNIQNKKLKSLAEKIIKDSHDRLDTYNGHTTNSKIQIPPSYKIELSKKLLELQKESYNLIESILKCDSRYKGVTNELQEKYTQITKLVDQNMPDFNVSQIDNIETLNDTVNKYKEQLVDMRNIINGFNPKLKKDVEVKDAPSPPPGKKKSPLHKGG